MVRRKVLAGSVNWKDFYHPTQDRDPWESGRVSIINYGPEFLGLRFTKDEVEGGPEQFTRQHPELFGTGTTSAPEGWFFWAMLQVRGPMGQEGGWVYQKAVRPGGQKVGGATVDFVIESSPRPIACRIVTPWFHQNAGPEKNASDREQLYMLQDAGYDVGDAFSELYMDDPEGYAVKDMALRIIERDPSLVPGSSVYLGLAL